MLFFFKIYVYIIIILAMVGLGYCKQAFSSCGEQGLLFTGVCGLLLLRSTGSRHTGFSGWGTWPLECWLSSYGAQA